MRAGGGGGEALASFIKSLFSSEEGRSLSKAYTEGLSGSLTKQKLHHVTRERKRPLCLRIKKDGLAV